MGQIRNGRTTCITIDLSISGFMYLSIKPPIHLFDKQQVWSSTLLLCILEGGQKMGDPPLSWLLPRSSPPHLCPPPPLCYSSPCAAGALCLTSSLLPESLLTGAAVGLAVRGKNHTATTDIRLITYIRLYDTACSARVLFFIISHWEHDWWHSNQAAFAKSPRQLCSIDETIKEEVAQRNPVALLENNSFFLVFVIADMHLHSAFGCALHSTHAIVHCKSSVRRKPLKISPTVCGFYLVSMFILCWVCDGGFNITTFILLLIHIMQLGK